MTRKKDTAENPDDAFLEMHFEAARRQAPAPGKDVLQRILDDAETEQTSWTPSAVTPALPQPRGFGALLQALGGWPAAASLSSAAAMGLWIGIAPPDTLTLVAQDLLPVQTEDTGETDSGFGFLEEML